jgi:hypothetical protein
MRQHKHDEKKVRLSVDCTEQERMYIKMLATKNHMTISEYLLSFARKEMPECGGHHCKHGHEPNEETAKVLRETEKRDNLIKHDTLEEFWSALGFDKHS